jgi:mitochondrial fission protein ELM1
MNEQSWIISEGYAGLQAQALGLAEAAGLSPDLRVLRRRRLWSMLPPRLWPSPRLGVEREALRGPVPSLIIGCGGLAAAVGAGPARRPARRPATRIVQIQHPRMRLDRFDLIVAARHDELTGPNVVVTRTALHRVTAARLDAAAAEWAQRLAHLPRPLVAVLVGGSNGRFRLDLPVGTALAAQLASMIKADKVGLALTPSRRTDAAVTAVLTEQLSPLGGWVWDGTGENPYFGLLALADAIVVTGDSVSMVSEAAATRAPVMLAPLPGRSRRIHLFLEGLRADGRVRDFGGRLDLWPVEPINDTAEAAAEMWRRLGG